MRKKILIELNAYVEELDEDEFRLILAHDDLEDALIFRSNSEREIEMLLDDLHEEGEKVQQAQAPKVIPMGTSSSIWPSAPQQAQRLVEPVRTVNVSSPVAPAANAIDQMAGDVLDIKSLWKRLRST